MPKPGQSHLEYLLLITVVTLAILYAARGCGPLQGGLESYFNQLHTQINQTLQGN